jgi:hypothetical protein
MANCTYIDGIGSSTALDTAGEVVDLKGLDCSSLVGGAFNYEHKSDVPAQIVGKILKIKKIFEESDCEDDRQRMYWESCKIPFLYVMGRLFDDKKDSSKEVAALFLDDAEHPNESPMVGFSVEGSRINKEGMILTHSIARKVTITNNPANKTCIAKMVPSQASKPKDDFEAIFKSEDYIEIDLNKNSQNDLAKALSLVTGQGRKIGQTSSGKDVYSHARIGEYHDFSAQDHTDAMNAHHNEAQKTTNQKVKSFHADKAKLHMGRRDTMERLAGQRKAQLKDTREKASERNVPLNTNSEKLFDPRLSTIKKAMDAGSAMAAPSQLTGTAALSRESLDKKPKKSKWLLRAEEEYNSWSKREEFQKFMQEKLPQLNKYEIDAIGKALILDIVFKAEQKLAKIARIKK